MTRFHTAGRRQPDLIGKDASGRRIPGGPYTVMQLGVFLALLVALWMTKGLWAAGRSGLFAIGITVGIAVLGAVLVQKLDFGGQNPLYLGVSYFGGLGGRRPTPVRRGRPGPARTVAIHAAADPATPEPNQTPALPDPEQPGTPQPQPDPRPAGNTSEATASEATGSALEQFLAAGRRVR